MKQMTEDQKKDYHRALGLAATDDRLRKMTLTQIISEVLAKPVVIESPKLSTVWLDYLRAKSQLARAQQIAQRIGQWLESIPATRTIGSIETEQVARWLANIDNPTTRNTYRNDLCAFFSWARLHGHLPSGPHAIERIPLFKVPLVDPVPMPVGDLKNLLKYLMQANQPNLLRLVTLCAFTGVRMGEAFRINSSDFASGLLSLGSEQTKTRKRRTVKIPPVLNRWMGHIATMEWADHVSWNSKYLAGSPSHIQNELSGLYRYACPDTPRVRNGLRKGWISARVALGHPLEEVAREAGHSVSTLQTYYHGLMSPEDAAAWFALSPHTVG